MDFEYPQLLYTDTVSVSVAQHTTVKMSNRSENRGRGYDFIAKENDASRAVEGCNYETQWQRVFTGMDRDRIRFVNVTGWNEWVALKLSDESGQYFMVDQFNPEYSRDLEPVRGEYGDNYYMQTIQNIRTWKYSEAKHYRYEEISADVNSFADESWKQAATYLDFTGECIERDHLSFDGSFRLEDTSNRNDIAKVSVLHDSEYVYFRVETVDNITAYEEGDSGWMNIFVGTEGSGAEKFLDYGYVINRRVSGNKTGVFKYADGAWKETAEGDIYVQGNVMQVRVKLSDLGMSADNYCMQFKVTDNVKNETDPLSFYTTGDSAPIGRLSYTYDY